ncbi:MAG: hypothetical protein B6D55_06290 [Candidatus Omnitrophica bacterium 4484_70.2]|nr:MAG: hypothetical protein B6D55_06290 [Candidatus Omnitrophica bacterium 4484_70.2]
MNNKVFKARRADNGVEVYGDRVELIPSNNFAILVDQIVDDEGNIIKENFWVVELNSIEKIDKKFPFKIHKGFIYQIREFQPNDEVTIYYGGKVLRITYNELKNYWKVQLLNEGEASDSEGIYISNL